jgi:excisionase family DNA binding protein
MAGARSCRKEIGVDERRREWFTVAQVAELVQVNGETVRRWIRGGDLSVLNVSTPGRPDYRIRRDGLDAFISRRYGAAGQAVAAWTSERPCGRPVPGVSRAGGESVAGEGRAMSDAYSSKDFEADYVNARRNRRFRAWLFVNDPEALAVLDHVPVAAAMTRADFMALHRATERYGWAQVAFTERLGPIRLALLDLMPSGGRRATETVGEAWAAAGRDPDELRPVVADARALLPIDGADRAIATYLDAHGVAAAEIAELLASWPREDTA